MNQEVFCRIMDDIADERDKMDGTGEMLVELARTPTETILEICRYVVLAKPKFASKLKHHFRGVMVRVAAMAVGAIRAYDARMEPEGEEVKRSEEPVAVSAPPGDPDMSGCAKDCWGCVHHICDNEVAFAPVEEDHTSELGDLALEDVAAVAAERKYQDKKWDTRFDDRHTVSDWISRISRYAGLASMIDVTVRSNNVEGLAQEQADREERFRTGMISVAAIAFAALQAQRRNGKIPPRHYDDCGSECWDCDIACSRQQVEGPPEPATESKHLIPFGEPVELSDREEWREYKFPGDVKIRIDTPQLLILSESGHRILDSDGISHYIPKGWVHLRWKNKPGRDGGFWCNDDPTPAAHDLEEAEVNTDG